MDTAVGGVSDQSEALICLPVGEIRALEKSPSKQATSCNPGGTTRSDRSFARKPGWLVGLYLSADIPGIAMPGGSRAELWG